CLPGLYGPQETRPSARQGDSLLPGFQAARLFGYLTCVASLQTYAATGPSRDCAFHDHVHGRLGYVRVVPDPGERLIALPPAQRFSYSPPPRVSSYAWPLPHRVRPFGGVADAPIRVVAAVKRLLFLQASWLPS